MGFTPPYLEVRKVAGGWGVYAPTGTTGDDVTIYPNTTDTVPYLTLQGNGQPLIGHQSVNPLHFVDASAGRYLAFSYTSPDAIIKNYIADKNIYLQTQGTGVVKFGTYTAGAATDSTGYITIQDAAGNTRKLMVQA